MRVSKKAKALFQSTDKLECLILKDILKLTGWKEMRVFKCPFEYHYLCLGRRNLEKQQLQLILDLPTGYATTGTLSGLKQTCQSSGPVPTPEE